MVFLNGRACGRAVWRPVSLACWMVCAAAQAQDVVFEVAPVVVTGAAPGSLSPRTLLTSVDSFGGSPLQDMAVVHNWQLFSRLPGVQLTNFNQGTTSGKPSFRGFNGEGEVNAVKLLIDGVPSNSNDGNMPYLDLVNPLGLASITSVRGTNDARYGLHNIAGNLELRTRQGGQANEVIVGAGAWGRGEAQLAIDRENEGFTQNYTLGLTHTDGWREHSQYERINLGGRWTLPVNGDTRLSLAVRALKSRADEPGYLTAADADADPRQSYDISATDGGERWVGQASVGVEGGLRQALSWRALAYVNRYSDQRWVRYSAAVSQQERLTNEVHQGARAIVTWRPAQTMLHDLALEGGVDTERQSNRSERYTTDARVRTSQTRDQDWTLNVHGAFVQAVIQPTSSLKLVPGYRVDRVSGQLDNALDGSRYGANDYGSILQPKFSLVWSPSEAWSVYANWGRSFQIGVGAASYKVPPRTSDLSPSMNTGSEWGVKFKPSPMLEGRVAVWRQTATDEVYRDLNNPSGDSTNIGATRRRGLDLQLRSQVNAALSVFGTLGLQKATITTPNPATPETAGQEVDHVPRRLFNAGVDWLATPELKLSAWLQGQSSYWLERSNRLTGRYGAYRTLNLSTSWQVTPALQLQTQVLNVLNGQREYVWWDGSQTLHAPGEPRSLNVSLHASF